MEERQLLKEIELEISDVLNSLRLNPNDLSAREDLKDYVRMRDQSIVVLARLERGM